MKFVFSTSSEAGFSGVREMDPFINGQAPTVPFAEVHDDGTGTFASLEPEAANLDAEDPKVRFQGTQAHRLKLAVQRDARYAYARRTALLRHSVRAQYLQPFDAGYAFLTCGM